MMSSGIGHGVGRAGDMDPHILELEGEPLPVRGQLYSIGTAPPLADWAMLSTLASGRFATLSGRCGFLA